MIECPYTPEDLADFGYRIEFGDPADPMFEKNDLAGRYWWTNVDPIVGGDVMNSENDWPTADLAIENARRFMAAND